MSRGWSIAGSVLLWRSSRRIHPPLPYFFASYALVLGALGLVALLIHVT